MKFQTIAAIGAAAFALTATPALAGDHSEAANLGPAVGAVIPGDLAVKDSSGKTQTFDTLVGENGMALYFIRSVDWCPYCKAQTIDVDKAKSEFDERGLSLVFLSYDPVKKQAAFKKSNDLGLTLISDPKSEIIDAFGLRNESHAAGARFAGIPHPATFVIAPDKTILAKLYEEDFATNDKSYRNRIAVDKVLAAADGAMADGSQVAMMEDDKMKESDSAMEDDHMMEEGDDSMMEEDNAMKEEEGDDMKDDDVMMEDDSMMEEDDNMSDDEEMMDEPN